MKTSTLFQPAPDQLARLVANHPFGLLISGDGVDCMATPLPMLLNEDGGQQTIIGHFARANPQLDMLRRSPRALAVFQGVHGYISPSWLEDRTQAPTWNFATVQFTVHVQLLDDRASAAAAVEQLTAAMEEGRPRAWSPADMGERYQRLLPHVVAFRADVLDVRAKFKLGQNERMAELEQAIIGLERCGQSGMAAAMREANLARLERKDLSA